MKELRDLTEKLHAVAPDLGEAAKEQGLGAIGSYLLNMLTRNDTKTFAAIFDVIEDAVIFSSQPFRQKILVDVLEDLKNRCSLQDCDYAVFEQWLGAETHVAWRWLEKRWQGKKSLADSARKATGQ